MNFASFNLCFKILSSIIFVFMCLPINVCLRFFSSFLIVSILFVTYFGDIAHSLFNNLLVQNIYNWLHLSHLCPQGSAASPSTRAKRRAYRRLTRNESRYHSGKMRKWLMRCWTIELSISNWILLLTMRFALQNATKPIVNWEVAIEAFSWNSQI